MVPSPVFAPLRPRYCQSVKPAVENAGRYETERNVRDIRSHSRKSKLCALKFLLFLVSRKKGTISNPIYFSRFDHASESAGVEMGGGKRVSLGQEGQRFHARWRMRFYGFASGAEHKRYPIGNCDVFNIQTFDTRMYTRCMI